MIEVKGRAVFVRDVAPDDLRSLARNYWVADIRPGPEPERDGDSAPGLRCHLPMRRGACSGPDGQGPAGPPRPHRSLAGFRCRWSGSVPISTPRRPTSGRRSSTHGRKGILPVYLVDSLGRYLLGRRRSASALGIAAGLLIGLNRPPRARMLARSSTSSSRSSRSPGSRSSSSGSATASRRSSSPWSTSSSSRSSTTRSSACAPSRRSTSTRSARSAPAARQLIVEVILPAALPNIITGLRVGAGFAFRGLVFAEIIAAKTGIGYLIFEGAPTQQTARTIVGMIVMGLLWLLLRPLLPEAVRAGHHRALGPGDHGGGARMSRR